MAHRMRFILVGVLVALALVWSALAVIESRAEVRAIKATYTHKPYFRELYGSSEAVVHNIDVRLTGLQPSLFPRFDYGVTVDLTVDGERIKRRESALFTSRGSMQYTGGSER